MLITLSQAQAINSSPIFAVKLPTAVSYQFAKLGKVIAGELKTFGEEQMKLIKTCNGVPSETDPNYFTFSPDTAPAFQIGMTDLLSAEFDIGGTWPMDLAKLGAVELSPAELMQLDPLFTIPE
jgi:hypothetical protein